MTGVTITNGTDDVALPPPRRSYLVLVFPAETWTHKLSLLSVIIAFGVLTIMMHLLLSTLFLGAACIGIQADVPQIPLQLEPYSSHISWNFSEKPSPDSKSHIIFDNVNSFLQHWTNTRYRNGQIIVGLIPLI